MIEAIIFDMDGLMIDSEPFHYKAFNKVLKSFGKELTEEENNERYVGISDVDAAEDMVIRFKVPLSPEQLVRRKQAQYREIIYNQVVPQPGLIELLKKLQQKGYKKAIASSSALSEIEMVINALHINSFVDSYCSAEQVARGKPAPDIFLLVAKELNVKPSQCLVLEDATSGVEAAVAAGIRCYAIPSKETKGGVFANADRVLNGLEEAFGYILLDSKN